MFPVASLFPPFSDNDILIFFGESFLPHSNEIRELPPHGEGLPESDTDIDGRELSNEVLTLTPGNRGFSFHNRCLIC